MKYTVLVHNYKSLLLLSTDRKETAQRENPNYTVVGVYDLEPDEKYKMFYEVHKKELNSDISIINRFKKVFKEVYNELCFL